MALASLGGLNVGVIGDRLKIIGTIGNIYRRNSALVSVKTEVDLADTSYTVGTGKTFALTVFSANYNDQTPVTVRLLKQTGGAGAWGEEARLTLKQHPQDLGHANFPVDGGVVIGTATDVFKLVYESKLVRGRIWAAFAGVEY
jgi:hypothetical protein